jgi:hypothetical protein
MKREQEVVTAAGSGSVPAMVAPTLYPLATLHMASDFTTQGRVPAWMAAAAGMDAPIAVWWDYPPS